MEKTSSPGFSQKFVSILLAVYHSTSRKLCACKIQDYINYQSTSEFVRSSIGKGSQKVNSWFKLKFLKYFIFHDTFNV